MRILLAVDGSEQSDEAVAEVARRPWPKGSVFRVVSAIENVPLGLVGLPVTYFHELTDSYGDAINGSPKHVIVDEANTWGADLIVVGAYGHGTLERFVLGSVPQAVVHHAECSVEIRSRGPAKH